jgi:uncharacterized phage protein (TIGR01671 family)
MNNLKFRAWSVNNKQMYYATPYRGYIKSNGSWWGLYNGDDVEVATSANDELMQYIGTKDKNGVEIYEWDIIELESISDIKEKFIIKYYNNVNIGCNGGEYTFEVSGYVPTKIDGTVDEFGDCEFAYYKLLSNEVKVVGNIHENGDLSK